MSLTNLQIADLLARSAAEAESYRQRAYIKASRGALAWTEEAADVLSVIANPIEQSHYVQRVATLLKVTEDAVRNLAGWKGAPPGGGQAHFAPKAPQNEPDPDRSRRLLAFVLVGRGEEDIRQIGFDAQHFI